MATVLIVCGSEDVCFLLGEILRSHMTCTVATATDMEAGLAKVHRDAPDTIILDAGLPDVNGLRPLDILKKDESAGTVPIILLLERAEDLRRSGEGWDGELVDYVIQPVDHLELTRRVKTMLTIKRLLDKAKATESRSHGARLSPLEAHSLRSPLNSIIGMAELIQKPYFGSLTEKQTEFAQVIIKSGHRLLGVINGLADED